MRPGWAGLAVVWLLVGAAHAVAQKTTVILVRHAERAEQPATDPPLNDIGQRRAEALAESLGHAGIDVVIATDFKRTQQTAAPLATKIGVPVNVVSTSGGAARYASDLAAQIRRDHKGKTVLVVGHSNTTPEVIKALGAGTVPSIPDSEFNNLYVVTVGEDGKAVVIRAKY
jgi:broad specificity phosphatase PhoE